MEKFQKGCPNLRILNANHTMLSLVETPVKEQIQSPGFPLLRELYIAVDSRGYFDGMDDGQIERILKKSADLRTLDVRGCQVRIQPSNYTQWMHSVTTLPLALKLILIFPILFHFTACHWIVFDSLADLGCWKAGSCWLQCCFCLSWWSWTHGSKVVKNTEGIRCQWNYGNPNHQQCFRSTYWCCPRHSCEKVEHMQHFSKPKATHKATKELSNHWIPKPIILPRAATGYEETVCQ